MENSIYIFGSTARTCSFTASDVVQSAYRVRADNSRHCRSSFIASSDRIRTAKVCIYKHSKITPYVCLQVKGKFPSLSRRVYIEAEEKGLRETLESLIKEESWKPMEDAAQTNVLRSASELFAVIKKSLQRCSRFVSRGEPMLHLMGAFQVSALFFCRQYLSARQKHILCCFGFGKFRSPCIAMCASVKPRMESRWQRNACLIFCKALWGHTESFWWLCSGCCTHTRGS